MKQRIKVFILGSCVSRNTFAVDDHQDFEIVAYAARTSLASQITPPYVDEKIVGNIKSSFQKRMVLADMEKTVFKDVTEKDHDILLMDLIDERHDLSIYGESIHTRCSEYMSGLYEPNPYQIIGKYSADKLARWKNGFDTLLALLHKNNAVQKLVINKAYLTDKPNAPPPRIYSASALQYIERSNEFLNLMYDYILQKIPEANFIEYNDEELVSDVSHRWGYAAFHYVRAFEERQLKYLLEFSKG